MLNHGDVPYLLNALDIGIVSHRNSAAGRFGFPYKAYEMVACGLPLVAASVGAMTALLDDCPDSLYKPDNSADLRRAIRYQLETPCRSTKSAPDWDNIAKILERFLLNLVIPADRRT
jgi:glycosyltransferase involved in cell wall biosynthesis